MKALLTAVGCGVVGFGILQLGMWLHPGGHVGQNIGFWDGLFATTGLLLIMGSILVAVVILVEILSGERG